MRCRRTEAPLSAPRFPLAISVRDARPFAEYGEIHERLLRAGVPSVHVGVVRDLAVSYGAGESDQAPYLLRARVDGVVTVRRMSGGSGVLHTPGDLVWAVILPRSDARVGRDFVRAYDRLGRGLVTFLKKHGIRGGWVTAPGLSKEYCPLGGRGLVLEANGRILAAAAQHLTGSALLHHGTLPCSLDRTRVARWFDLEEPGPADRLTSLSDLGISVRGETLARQVAEGLVAGLDLRSA